MIKFADVTKLYDKNTLALKNGTIIREEIRGHYNYDN